jgi:hypothetical protein
MRAKFKMATKLMYFFYFLEPFKILKSSLYKRSVMVFSNFFSVRKTRSKGIF